jgi:ribosomal protein S18 acetylase RimI-like enzyme
LDAEALVALMKSVASEGRWIRTEWPFDESVRVERFRASLRERRALCIVAERDGTIVGQVTVFPNGELAELGTFVAREERGRGIGRRLLEAAEDLARRRSLKDLELEVYAHNEPAINLYRSAGFEAFGERTSEARRSGETFQTLRMHKSLRAHQEP